jgi:NADPH:quinone reductase-like Zn-dependent oxidoreductase
MKAIVQDRYGSADVLALTDIAAPVVGDDDVLVRVHAAGCGIPKPARLPHRAGRGRSHLQCHRPPGPPRQSRVRPEQKVLIIGAAGGVGHGPGAFFRGVLRAPLLSLFVGQKLRGLNAKVNQEDLRTVGELIETGKFTPVIDRTYPLVETAEALRYPERGHPRGKVVITV